MIFRKIAKLSLAAPAYNEGEAISFVISRWVEFLQSVPILSAFEIVICDDGSKDDTSVVLRDLAKKVPELRVVTHQKNKGAGSALYTAIQNTTGDYVLLIDSDGQFPIESVNAFFDALSNGDACAFIGNRLKKDDSLFARLGSFVSGQICNWIYNVKYRDFNCALKLVKGDVIRALRMECKGLNYSTEVSGKLLEMGVPMTEVAVEHHKRRKGRSSRTLFRSAIHRFLFVAYLGFRFFLVRQEVLQKP